MYFFKKIFPLCLVLLLFACSKKPHTDVVVGTISGPETELALVAQQVAKKKFNLAVKIVEFSDYNLPNEALADGTLDANIYQHLPFLTESIKARGYKLAVIGKTFIYPMGIFSAKYKNIKDILEQAVVSIPNDPSNQTRALTLLAKAGLITLPKKFTTVGLKDIIENKHHLVIKELDAAQLPRMLADVDLAVINTTFAIPAGLNPVKDALFLETKDSPYANLIVVRASELKNPKLLLFVEAMHSPEVIAKSRELFGDNALPAWN